MKQQNSKVSPKNNEAEFLSLKKDFDILKTDSSKKEELIKQLNNKVKQFENDIRNLNNALIDSSEKFNEEISKRNDDLEFYKRSYEEQKNRVNKEHELISSSLYELALQFMGLKNELQKKLNPNNFSFTRNENQSNK